MSDFKQLVPGLYLPTRANIETPMNDKFTVVMSDLMLNKPIANSELAFRYPKGTLVNDDLKMVEYRTDELGNPDGPVRPLIKPSPPVVPAKK